MRQKKNLIMGIGHRVKSLENPDTRVTISKEYALFSNNGIFVNLTARNNEQSMPTAQEDTLAPQ